MTLPSDNYMASIEVSASTEESFDAVATQMRQWWTETIEGELTKLGDNVKAIFPSDYGYWTFKVTAFDRGARIEMVCIEAHHQVEGQPKEIDQEWLGTRINWEFARLGEKTKITLTHHGLTPQLNCWGMCLDGWNHFFKTSLKDFLNGGIASPHRVTKVKVSSGPL